jgi:hypothetical protein
VTTWWNEVERVCGANYDMAGNLAISPRCVQAALPPHSLTRTVKGWGKPNRMAWRTGHIVHGSAGAAWLGDWHSRRNGGVMLLFSSCARDMFFVRCIEWESR